MVRIATTTGRYSRWAKARRMVREIQAHLTAGGAVIVATHLRAVRYGAKHVAMFKATASGAFVQRGKSWDCIDGCAVRFSR